MLIKKNKAEFLSCNLAGFGHTEGYLVLDQMKPGDKLAMIREDENKYDPEAIALFYRDLHVGYIPKQLNSQLATFLDFGHADIFECVITSIDKDEHPNEQVQIRVNILRRLPEDMRKVLNDFRKQSTWHLTKTVKEEQKKAEAEQLDQFKAIMRWKLGLGNMGATLAGGNVMPQKTHRAEWHEGLLPMPDHDVTTMDVSIPLTTEQRNILLLGHIPECQEDHWYMYDDCGCISYHRSWTGMCAFQAFFRPVDDGYEIDKLTMNHELAEFGVNGDMAGVALFRYLIAAEVGDNAEFWWQNYLDAWQELYEKYSKK